jgi:tRNA 2-thiocytidine biosynthesis protein TtcA
MNIEKKVHRRVGEAIRKHRMIEDGDRLLVAVSGGQDSCVLSHVLKEKQRIFPIHFELIACHIVTDVAPRDGEKEKRLDAFFAGLEIPLKRYFVPVIERLDEGRKMNCFFCAMQRRMKLLKVALENDCTKIAYGHHMDDIIETLFLNMFYNAEISTMPARLELDDHDMVFVRPFCLTKKREIKTYAKRFGLTDLEQDCPYGKDGRRERVRRIIDELAGEDERIRDNLSRSLGRVKNDYLIEKLRK